MHENGKAENLFDNLVIPLFFKPSGCFYACPEK